MIEISLEIILAEKILPAVTFEKTADALPVAETFLRAGLKVLEIPMRTKVAAEAISIIRKKYPEMYVGAGTILSNTQLHEAINAGAHFGLAPGLNLHICQEAAGNDFTFIPGVMTPSEIETAAGHGFGTLKIFPAEQLGGVAFLKALQGPYEQLKIKFIPMGGVSMENLVTYTNLKQVIAVGGSWLATKELIAAKNYKAIEQNILAAMQLIR